MDEYNEDHREPSEELELRKVEALEAIQRHLKMLFIPACVIAGMMIGLVIK